LCTTCPRMAPRPPPAAKRFTLRSAMRTPEQKPYFCARLMIISGPNAIRRENILGSLLVVGGSSSRPPGRQPTTNNQLQSALHVRPRALVHPPLRDAVDIRIHHLLLGFSAPSGHPAAHPGARRVEGRGRMVSDRLHTLQRV